VTTPLSFTLAAFILLAVPGPTNTLLWIGGAERGARRALPLALAEVAGYATAIMLILFLLQPLLEAVPWLRQALSLVVACYVLVLAQRLWRPLHNTPTTPTQITVAKVYAVTLLNPKAFVLALSILPASNPGLHWYLLALAGIILSVGSGWVVLGALVGAAVGAGNVLMLKRVSAVVLAGFASLLLWRVLQGFLT
jgi:threonine/homoserine/homoserine lactone efflux protein